MAPSRKPVGRADIYIHIYVCMYVRYPIIIRDVCSAAHALVVKEMNE